jgi:hypothetical protein
VPPRVGRRQQLSATAPLSPFGLVAVHVKIALPRGYEITSSMSVTVSTGLIPVQLGFGQSASFSRHSGRGRQDGRVRCDREIAVIDLACRERGRRRRGTDQDLVLPRRGVATPVLALVERGAAHAQVGLDVEVPKAGKDGRTCGRRAWSRE